MVLIQTLAIQGLCAGRETRVGVGDGGVKPLSSRATVRAAFDRIQWFRSCGPRVVRGVVVRAPYAKTYARRRAALGAIEG